jgi:hypothetical protein
MPRYIQWMNQSGTLKITHKVRVKFSIGNYFDTMDCDVAPMSACHLLLVPLGDEAQVEAHFGPFANSANLMQDRCTICIERTNCLEIVLDTPDGTPR